MGIYKYIKQLWKKPKQNMPDLWKERLVKWRREPVSVRIEKPTRLDKARELGYKSIKGFVIVRQRVSKGGRMRPKIRKARRPKARRHKKIVAQNYQTIAEQRANKKYKNCEVLNSYWVAEDGLYKWYEVLLVDKEHPEIKSRKNLEWISKPQQRGRVYRGLTSASKKSRGLRNKGKGAEKVRPSLRAKNRRAH
jgi:large subunit ribosomal protein L15e